MTKIKRNDQGVVIPYTLPEEYRKQEIASVEFLLENKRSTALAAKGEAVIVDPAAGHLAYTLAEGETLGAGIHIGEFQVTYADGTFLSFPRSGYLEVDIQRNIDGGRALESEERIAVKVSLIDEKFDAMEQKNEAFKAAIEDETAEWRESVADDVLADVYEQVDVDRVSNTEVREARGGEVTLGAKIAKVDSQLAQTAEQLEETEEELALKDKITNKRTELMNTATDLIGLLDLANFAGQGTAARDIMAKLHNYTDSDVMWLDNVGEGNTVLRLNNARNPLRRPDKPSDYVGKGKFLVLGTANTSGGYIVEMEVDSEGNLKWQGQRAKPSILENLKTNQTNIPAFIFRTPSGRHDKVVQIQSKATNQEIMSFGVHGNGTLAEIDIGADMTQGLSINTPNGAPVQINGRDIPNVRKGAFPPTNINPEKSDQIFIDTLNNKAYISKGTSTSDWIPLF